MGSSHSKPESSFRKSLGRKPDKPALESNSSGQTTLISASSSPLPPLRPLPVSDPNAGFVPLLAPPSVPAEADPATLTSATPVLATIPPSNAVLSAKPAALSTSVSGSNATQTTTTPGLWAVLETSLRALHRSTEVFPPVWSAIGSLIACLDVMQRLSENNNERQALASELADLSNLMVQHMEQCNSARMSGAVINVARGIEEQVKVIEEMRNRDAGWRLLEAHDDELLSKCYRRIGSLFRQLQADASMSIWKIVNEQATNALFDRLGPVHLATYDSTLSTSISRRTCTANTRTAILSGLNDWSYNSNLADIYWMNGMAGTGKTTIAYTFSELLEQEKRLAASFFCTRTVPECRAATRILPTIAYQLARYSIPFRSALCESLQDNPDAGTSNLTKQFDLLLKEPLSKVKEAIPNYLVVVIDALDECDDMRQVELLLRLLLKGAKGLPLKFFVTSRPEPEVYNRMMSHDQGSRDVLHLHEVEKSLVQADINLYLQEELAPMSPKPTDIQELVHRSGTLFIYAATLVRYIEPDNATNNPTRRLQSVLSVTSTSAVQYSAIDTLYMVVLHAALDDSGREAAEVDEVRRVLQTIVCAQEPLSMEVLAVVAKLDDKAQAVAALQRLRAVIHVSETSGLVSTLHASFPDFMFTQARSQAYHCDLANFSEGLAQRCLEVMESQLRFNICSLESSFVPDAKVEDLDEKLRQAVSPVLWYACQYWADHLEKSNYSDSLCSVLEGFLSNRLLFWMEVMNLKQSMGNGLRLLAKAKSWLSPQANTLSTNVMAYIEDARKFVSSFAANPVSQSTPHIYISSLPFCPKSSFVFKQYHSRTKGLMNVTGSSLNGRETAMIACWTVESEVYSIAVSPDGSRIAYGCNDRAAFVRSSDDGIVALPPLEGHTDLIGSVSYSPDGFRIASGSADNTIRIWNAQNGTMVAGPLQGHTDVINSVTHSPDGNSIASASKDKTILIWNARDGTPIAGPLEGHTGEVWDIAYSPDSSRIVSGSSDKTVRIWNAQDGTPATGPLLGHFRAAWSVAFSPNGTQVVSGSSDGTIRTWNAHDGAALAGPLVNHTDGILAVAYSPDGTLVISGSGDNAIHVWNARDGTLVAGPLKGHTQGVTSVAYSADGTRIISGSYDCTIRVWDARGDSFDAKEPDGHTDSINSVAYSPDGTRIVSGSSDHTIRIWHAHNGSLLVGPFHGHKGTVRSVAYSPVGTCIVSGSDDHTVRVWDAQGGALIVGPLEGHTSSVLSVAYSPDGTRIVSGSVDRTILVWDAQDGTLVTGPLEGHDGWVRSVVYSPDGVHIASGSSDRTIRVWSSQDGTLATGPLEGHAESVLSVMYSPNGTHIASGSADRTVRVWNAQDGTLAAGPFEGHKYHIFSVAYSPDGTHIVSGSFDETIRVWNARDGVLVAGPLRGHTDSINSVAYSPSGTRIVSGSADQAIRVWSAHNDTSILGSQVDGPERTNEEIIYPIANGISTGASGWVTASDSWLLFWVPPEVQPRDMLSQFQCQMVIDPTATLVVDYDNLLLGRRWSECYRS